MAQKVPETKSEWDGREKFFEQWDEDRRCIRNCLILEDYHAALDYLSTWIVNFSGYTDLDVAAIRHEITDLLSQINNNEQFGDEIFMQKGAALRLELKNRFYFYMSELTKIMNRLRMLVPLTEMLVMDDPAHVADNYERLVYGEVCISPNKTIPSLVEFGESYPFIGDNLKEIIIRQRWLNENKRKDCLWIICGYPGSGKSTLAHHIHDFETMGAPEVNNVAFDRETFSQVIDTSLNKEKIADRFTHYDEANITKREGMSNWNKDMIDLYDAIRAKNGFHIWCNPSVQYLEGKFISERINAILFIYEGTGRRRRYAMIPRKKLMELLEKKDNLKLDTLNKYAKDFACDYGWFENYPKNDFLKTYEQRKEERMTFKIEKFKENWSDTPKTLSLNNLGMKIKTSPLTITKILTDLDKEGLLKLDEVKTPTGQYNFTPAHEEIIKEGLKKKYKWKTFEETEEQRAEQDGDH